MFVRFIDGPLKGQTKDVAFLTAQSLFARRMAVDVRKAILDEPQATTDPAPPIKRYASKAKLG